MSRRVMSLILVLSTLALSACAGADSAKSRTGTVADAATSEAYDEALDKLQSEVLRLESQVERLNEELIQESSLADLEMEKISSHLSQREEDLAILQEAYEQSEEERMALAKAYQQSKNELGQLLNRDSDLRDAGAEHAMQVEAYTEVGYDQLMETSEQYYMRQVTFMAEVLRIDEGREITQVLAGFAGEAEALILLEFAKSQIDDSPIYVGDDLTLYGTSFGLLEVKCPDGSSTAACGVNVDLYHDSGQ